jgi:hypothetical protein
MELTYLLLLFNLDFLTKGKEPPLTQIIAKCRQKCRSIVKMHKMRETGTLDLSFWTPIDIFLIYLMYKFKIESLRLHCSRYYIVSPSSMMIAVPFESL